MNDSSTALQVPEMHDIGVELFSRRHNKTTQLINNTDPIKNIDGKRRWYEYEFEQPVYIQNISVSASGYESFHGVEFEVDHIDGTQHQQSVKFDGELTGVEIGKLAKGFRFRPDQRFLSLSAQTIKKVVVEGLTLAEFHSFEWALKHFEKDKKDLDEKVSNYTKTAEDLEAKKTEHKELLSKIGRLTAEAEKLSLQNTAQSDRISTENERLVSTKDDIRNLRDERSDLSKEITAKKKELTELTKELRVFPSEIAGFVREGRRAIQHYFILSVPFVAIICYVTYALFSSSIDLTQLWKQDESVDIWTVFLTRLPFVVVAIAVLEVCGYIIGRFIFEIVRINRQRLSLSRVSIISKDVTATAALGKELSEDEAFEHEVALKMELLREHMKEDVGESFEYKGTAIQNVFKSIAQRLSGGKTEGE